MQFDIVIFPEDIKAADALNPWNRNQLLTEIPLIKCMHTKTPKTGKKNALVHVHTDSS